MKRGSFAKDSLSRRIHLISTPPSILLCDNHVREPLPIQNDCRQVLVFTRNPEPGKTKTRLIPRLGAKGAAQLHESLIHHTLNTIRKCQHRFSTQVEVHFTGGSEETMAQRFGNDFSYQHQSPGNLGERIKTATNASYQKHREHVLVIGTDCPDITPEIIELAFDHLNLHDVVLGPAYDGGYYLIGTRHPAPQLFSNIDWGTNQVLEQTIRRAADQKLSVRLLTPHHDIDRPEDLVYLKRSQPTLSVDHGIPNATQKPENIPILQSSDSKNTPEISVIIPTYNEAGKILPLLGQLQNEKQCEVIVVDGGSRDETIRLCETCGARVISAPLGRAQQMNQGAQVHRASVLLFVHADTRLPKDFVSQILRTVKQPSFVAGAFRLAIDDPRLIFRWIAHFANLRSHFLGLPYGDQGLFVTAHLFHEISGFQPLPIMEDVELIRRLRRKGTLTTLPVPAITSARRWKKHGVLYTTLINQCCIIGYFLGVSPDRLARWYGRKVRSKHGVDP